MDFDGVRICGIAESLELGARISYWPEKTVTWNGRDSLPRLAIVDMKAVWNMGIEGWEPHCGIDFVYTSNPKTANILLTVANLGGASGVLADSHLPPAGLQSNSQFQAIQRYDSSEVWVVSDRPKAGEIDLVRVCCHEIGHAAGLPHMGDGLMAPMYSTKIRFPSAPVEIEAMQRGYGLPRPKEPPPTPDGKIIVHVEYDKATGKLLPGWHVTGARLSPHGA